MAHLLQSIPTSNAGEQRMLETLNCLPDAYSVLAELRVDAKFNERTKHLEERRPDFIVLGGNVGLVSVETKDWNLFINDYEYLNQAKVIRRSHRDGSTKEIDNPWQQARTYQEALKSLLDASCFSPIPWITSVVAFPLLTRSFFMSKFDVHRFQAEKNARFYCDPENTIFQDDIEASGIEKLLMKLAQKSGFKYKKDSLVAASNGLRALLPPKFVIGDASDHRKEQQQQITYLSERQQDLAFSMNQEPHLLLDLAGSGKTNILLSRALHLDEQAKNAGKNIKILLLTYSDKLKRSLELMLQDKLQKDLIPPTITIGTEMDLVRAILAEWFGDQDGSGIAALLSECSTPDQERNLLLSEFKEVVSKAGDRFRRFDTILIDEIQDFPRVLPALIKLIHKGKELLMAGDLAQRVYNREFQVSQLGFDSAVLRVDSDFCMYRCPSAVSQLAHALIAKDSVIMHELERMAYRGLPQFQGRKDAYPSLRRVVDGIACVQAIGESIKQATSSGIALKDMMAITSTEGVASLAAFLAESGVLTKTVPSSHNSVLVVDFVQSKGLEAHSVFIMGIEDLPTGTASAMLSDDKAADLEILSLSRRKVYVAMTRTTCDLAIVYHDDQHALCRGVKQAFGKNAVFA
jgi:hypothetical protein